MAKKSMVAREDKRARTVAKYASKRAKLKEIIGDVNADDDARWEAQVALQKLPRNAMNKVIKLQLVNLFE